jgi:hypothetical protein
VVRRVLLVARVSPYRRAPPVAIAPKDPGFAGVWTLVVLFLMLFAVALHDAPANAPLLRAVRELFVP